MYTKICTSGNSVFSTGCQGMWSLEAFKGINNWMHHIRKWLLLLGYRHKVCLHVNHSHTMVPNSKHFEGTGDREMHQNKVHTLVIQTNLQVRKKNVHVNRCRFTLEHSHIITLAGNYHKTTPLFFGLHHRCLAQGVVVTRRVVYFVIMEELV